MDGNFYQNCIIELSSTYDIFGTDKALMVYILGLPGEVGEVAEIVKRFYRGDSQPNLIQDLTKELGDALAYLALVAYEFNIDLNDVMETNVNKISGRVSDGTQLGTGSDR